MSKSPAGPKAGATEPPAPASDAPANDRREVGSGGPSAFQAALAFVSSDVGQPLSSDRRAYFESRLGANLGDVRLHQGSAAGAHSAALGANAFTVGSDVVLGQSSSGAGGMRSSTLAHELVHVAQNQRGPAPSKWLGTPGDGSEREADAGSHHLSRGQAFRPSSAPSGAIARQTPPTSTGSAAPSPSSSATPATTTTPPPPPRDWVLDSAKEANDFIAQSDWYHAFYLLNGLWIRDMIDVMKLLEESGNLDKLAAHFKEAEGKFGRTRMETAYNAVKARGGTLVFPADLEQAQQGEVNAFLKVRQWPTLLPHSGRKASEAITGVPNKAQLKRPTLSTAPAALSDEQEMVVDYIRRARHTIPSHASDLTLMPYGGKANQGYMYAGNPGKEPAPTATQGTSGAAARNKAIWKELGGEGGNTAINTYDDMTLTWGRGFAAKGGLLDAVMAKLPSSITNALLDIGIAFQGGKWLVVDGETGLVEEGSNALQLIRYDVQLLSGLIEIGLKHSQEFVDAQWDAMSFEAAVPASAQSWPVQKIQFVAHCLHWRSAVGWGSYAATGGDVAAMVRIISAQVGGVDAARGGARFLSQGQTITLNSFAGGLAKTVLGTAGPLPADIATAGKFAGHIFFQSSASDFYHLAP